MSASGAFVGTYSYLLYQNITFYGQLAQATLWPLLLNFEYN